MSAAVRLSGSSPPPAPAALPLAPASTLSETGLALVTPIAAADRLVEATEAGQVKAIDAADGHEVWVADHLTAAWLLAGDGLVFAGGDTHVVALDEASGFARWTIPLASSGAAPVWDPGWLFLTEQDGSVSAYRTSDGSRVWAYDSRAPLTGPPAVNGSNVALALDDGNIVVLDVLTGREAWRLKLPARPLAPLLAGGRVYVGAEDRSFYCLDAENHSLLWRFARLGKPAAPPRVDDDHVYLAGIDGVLYALDRISGALEWHQDLGSRIVATPIVRQHLVIAPIESGALRLFLAEDGGRAGTAAPGGPPLPDAHLAANPTSAGAESALRVVVMTKGFAPEEVVTVYARARLAAARLDAPPLQLVHLTPPH